MQSGLGRLSNALRSLTELRAQVLAAVCVLAPLLLISTFASSTSAAVLLGYSPWLAPTLPLGLDLVALIGTVVATRSRTKELRAFGTWLVYVPLAGSWAMNAVDHLHRSPAGSAWAWLWIAFVIVASGVPPVAFVALVHLAMRFTKPEKARRRPVTWEPTDHPLDVASPPADLGTVTPMPAPDSLEAMTVDDIRALAIKEDVAIRGSKAQIAARIREKRAEVSA